MFANAAVQYGLGELDGMAAGSSNVSTRKFVRVRATKTSCCVTWLSFTSYAERNPVRSLLLAKKTSTC